MYGLVHVSRQWLKKFKVVMAGCGYYPSKADPCLFLKKFEVDKPMTIVKIYFNDGGIIGTPEAIK
jgi:hypothetical protein